MTLKNKKPVLLDVDGVLAGFIEKMLSYINNRNVEKYPYTITKEQLYSNKDISADIRKCVKEWDELCEDLAKSEGFCQTLPVLPGAQKFVQDLKDKGFNIMYVTSPYKDSPTWAYDRIEWLKRHFGASRYDIISTPEKRYVDGICLVDDKPENIQDWAQYNERGYPILFDQPWNQRFNFKPSIGYRIRRTNDYNKIVSSLVEIYGAK